MSKIILICQDVIGERMAGPAIRYFEMACALAKYYEVTLFTLASASRLHPDFKIEKFSSTKLKEEIKGATALIAQNFSPLMVYLAKSNHVRLILDAYDPIPIENLELFKFESIKDQKTKLKRSLGSLKFSLKLSDFIVCANNRQKDLWLGMLCALNKLDPESYLKDPNLDQIIGMVPFGLSKEPPIKNGPGIREKLNLSKEAKVLVWGGGIWNWFDPLTLIKAIDILKDKMDIHLIFMGVKHPNEAIPEMKMCYDAVELSKKLDLFNKRVHFNFGWVPYHERQNILLDADLGVSTHFNHLETRYSFRTRLLDYMWAGLPIVATGGDCFEEVIEKHHIGACVLPIDAQNLAHIFEKLLNSPETIRKMKSNLANLVPEFYWERVIQSIHHYLEHQKKVSYRNHWSEKYMAINEFIKQKGPFNIVKYLCLRLIPKKLRENVR